MQQTETVTMQTVKMFLIGKETMPPLTPLKKGGNKPGLSNFWLS